MTETCYPEAIRRLLQHEGGYVNHPEDPGGPTNYGITIADYRKYVKPGATAEDVRVMKQAEATVIYRDKYAAPVHFDDLPCGLDYTIFDYAVNSGTGRVPKVLRRVLGLPDSAPFADVTAAIKKRDATAVITAVNDERLRFLKSLRIWPTFGAGWSRRVAEVKAVSLRMSKDQCGTAPDATVIAPSVPMPPAPGKGAIPATSATKSVVVAGGTAGAGIVGWMHAHPIEAGLLVAAACAAVAALIHLINYRHMSAQEAPTPGTPVVPELKPM